jgi:ubiquinone/menaquinone biosynthesis C-methylase UbiE
MNKIEIWLSKAELKSLNKIPWILKRSNFSKKIKNLSRNRISEITSYMTIEAHKNLVKEILLKLGIKLTGTGIEIGSGSGVLSNSIANLYNIKKIYAVEIVPGMVKNLQNKIFLKNQKIFPVVGSFDKLKVRDQSIDFIVEFDALHHSENLQKTLFELNRVLKPGGVIIAFDRAHPDYLSDSQIKYLLNIEYSNEYKKIYGIPLRNIFTRLENGEHEIREKEWKEFAFRAGFKEVSFYIFRSNSLNLFLRSVLALVPFQVRKLLKLGAGISMHYKVFLSFISPSLTKFFPGTTVYDLTSAPGGTFAPTSKMVIIMKK